MERNWLIRTSQNQILGPVAKQKLLEFIQKGALGMTDEVSSGNGYWFSIKEKELVEKYIYGDIPQSYNPISESKSVLSNREHPEKTTSINTAPANKTQVIKLSSVPGILPAADDLAFPDLGADSAKVELKDNDTKLPSDDDLAFPDMDDLLSFSASAQESQFNPLPTPQPVQSFEVKEKAPVKAAAIVQESDEDIVFPDEDDLAFPDLNEMKTSPKIEKGKVDLSTQYTRTVALDAEQSQEVFPEKKTEVQIEEEDDFGDFTLALDLTNKEKATEHDFPEEIKQPVLQAVKKERPQPQLDDRKLLHDRKTKSSAGAKSAAALRDPTREVAHANTQAEPLKKRNDNYLFFILIIIAMIIIAVFFYFKEILNKPLPV